MVSAVTTVHRRPALGLGLGKPETPKKRFHRGTFFGSSSFKNFPQRHLEPGRNRQAVNKLPTIKDAPAGPIKKASSG